MPVRHVLVVDDSKSARLMLRKMLQGFGLTVDTAESGEEALNYLRDRQPDAIFMDHTMPGMDGLTAVRQIKHDPLTAVIPVAMYTSRDEATYREEARIAGAIDVLTKPAIPEILGVVLEKMHQALDAAPIPVPASTTTVTETAVAKAVVAETVDTAWIEKIVIGRAESVFYDAIESQVLPLLNDVIAKLRRELEANQAASCRQIAQQVCEKQLAEWSLPHEQLTPFIDERLEALRDSERESLQGLAQDVAAQVCQSQLHELSVRLVQQLSARFAEAVRNAAATARDAAIEVARQAAIEAAQAAIAQQKLDEMPAVAAEAQNRAAEREFVVQQEWLEVRRNLMRHIYLAASGAAIVGMGAAALVYGLR